MAAFLTKLFAWVALSCAWVVYAHWLTAARRPVNAAQSAWRRRVWTLGCVAYVLHFVCAFQFYHHWSHTAAYADTARQTGEVTGWSWGGGIYVSYVFSTLWVLDVLWWWRGLKAYRSRPRGQQFAWHGFFLFMAFNATVVFGHGPIRYIGLAAFLVLGVLWWRKRSYEHNSIPLH